MKDILYRGYLFFVFWLFYFFFLDYLIHFDNFYVILNGVCFASVTWDLLKIYVSAPIKSGETIKENEVE